MSVAKHPDGRRSVQVETEVPGSPEEVWQAIATGPGISCWFVPTSLEERVDGKMTLNFGPGMDSHAKITAWNPPRSFAAESDGYGPNAPPMATEWTVEAKAGGTCVVRVVHSLFASTDEWDNQLLGTEAGWPTFFLILRIYLQHFRGQTCSFFQAMQMPPGSFDDGWKLIDGGLKLSAAVEGQPWRTPEGAPVMGGVVKRVSDVPKTHHDVVLQLDQPTTGLAVVGAYACGGAMLSMSVYLYGADATAAVDRERPKWLAWFEKLVKPAG